MYRHSSSFSPSPSPYPSPFHDFSCSFKKFNPGPFIFYSSLSYFLSHGMATCIIMSRPRIQIDYLEVVISKYSISSLFGIEFEFFESMQSQFMA